MGLRKIFAVGIRLPDIDGFITVDLNSEQSLLDADIILFKPSLDDFAVRFTEEFEGQPCFSQNQSFEVQSHIVHWHSQISTAYESGKTIVILLPKKQGYFRYTGDRQFSGTGRGRQTTNIVSAVNNYDLLPIAFEKVISGRGEAMKLAPKADVIADYWGRWAEHSMYEAHFETKGRSLVLTKSGDRTVGALLTGPNGGHCVCLPNLAWDEDGFVTKDGESWTKVAITFTTKLRDNIFGIDSALRANSDEFVEPDWAKIDDYRISIEATIEKEILDIGVVLEEQIKKREKIKGDLKRHAMLRCLLFDKGKRLEDAVRDALRLMGFDVENFKNGDSEFDAVFTSAEGRFLGEVEGKDSKPISIEKYSQLERNVNEDFARPEVTVPAKGVLFGNAHRATPPNERGEFFTEKVISAAKRTGSALVQTPDLFVAARYLKETADAKFAQTCREAISTTAGAIVKFPAIPTANQVNVSEGDR